VPVVPVAGMEDSTKSEMIWIMNAMEGERMRFLLFVLFVQSIFRPSEASQPENRVGRF
jgi:hypothetical protein